MGTKILGKSEATPSQMDAFVKKVNPSAPNYGAIFIKECEREGVRGDLAFAQSIKETNYFRFGGDVTADQNNFAGMGATGNSVKGLSFKTPKHGVLAQAQQLRCYATKEPTINPCINPRITTWFKNVKSGTSPEIEGLGGTWAVPGYSTKKYRSLALANAACDSYGYQILAILAKISLLPIDEEYDKKAYEDAGYINTVTESVSPVEVGTLKTYYRVQVGSYKLPGNAMSMVRKAKLQGFTDSFKEEVDDLYRVYLGSYTDKAKADDIKKKWRAKGNTGAIIKTFKK